MLASRTSRATAGIALAALAVIGARLVWKSAGRERIEDLHYQRGETELVVTNLAHARLRLFRAGASLRDAMETGEFNGRKWLPAANYFLRAQTPAGSVFYPAPIIGYRAGPEKRRLTRYHDPPSSPRSTSATPA